MAVSWLRSVPVAGAQRPPGRAAPGDRGGIAWGLYDGGGGDWGGGVGDGKNGTTTTEVAGRGRMYGRDAATDLDHRARDMLHQGDCGGGGTGCDAAVNRDRHGEGQSTCI